MTLWGRILVCCLKVFIGYVSQYYIFIPWFKATHYKHSIRDLILLNILLLLLWWTYYLSCTLDPGRVDRNWIPETETSEAGIRYCTLGDGFKPPRTHHCTPCGRYYCTSNIACQDIDNVGFRNHACFVRYILYVVTACSYILYTTVKILYYSILDQEELRVGSIVFIPTSVQVTVMVLTVVATGISTVSVSILAIYQLWCISENITSIESWSKKKTEDMIRKKKIPPIEFPYDVGFVQNLRCVFGDRNPILWLWPSLGPTQSGHSFVLNEDADPDRVWPPADPATATFLKVNQATITNAVTSSSDNTLLRRRTLFSHGHSDSDDNDLDSDLFTDDEHSDYIDPEGETLESHGVDTTNELTGSQSRLKSNQDLTLSDLINERRRLNSERNAL